MYTTDQINNQFFRSSGISNWQHKLANEILLNLILTFWSQIVENVHRCKGNMEKHTPVLMKAFIPLLLFTFIIGCLILPILLKKLRGHPSAYFFFQQLFAILYLTLIFFPFIFEHEIITKSSDFKFFMAFDSYKSIIILIPFIDFLKNLFHYQYYAFSLLLSLYYNSMVCNPMQFKEYRNL